VFPPRGFANGDELADLGGSQCERYTTHDSKTRAAWRPTGPAVFTSTSATEGRLPGRTKHHPDHRHCLLLRQ